MAEKQTPKGLVVGLIPNEMDTSTDKHEPVAEQTTVQKKGSQKPRK